MPDLPYADAGNPCTDPSRPHVFVVQQAGAPDALQGRLMRINQFGTVVAETYWALVAPPGSPPQNYGPSDMVGPINVDVEVSSPDCAGGSCGRVWVSLLVSPNGQSPPGWDRVWDVFDRNLCGLVGCGLGGDGPNTPLCAQPPSCTPCSPSCRTSVCTNSPFRTPFVKGNGASRFRDLISPCCGAFASQQWRWPWPRRRVL